MNHSDSLNAAGIHVELFPTSHDAADSMGIRLSVADGEGEVIDALGGCANTGYLTVEALEMLRDLRILGIEANHDANMLASGPYPSLHHAITASGRQRGKIAPHDGIGWRNSDRSLRML